MPEQTNNKVKYGLKNVHYATVTFAANGTPTFGTPARLPGAVSMTLSKVGDLVNFYADDGVYFEIADNGGYDGTLELALIPESFRTAALGESADSKGVLFENAEQVPGHIALLFEFAGDAKAIRHVLYNCTARQEEVAGQTKGESLEVQTEQLAIKARPLPDSKRVKAKTGDSTDTATYNAWYTSVHEYTAASAPAQGN